MTGSAEARAALLGLVGRIYVINMAHRADRRAGMARQLGRLGLGFDHPAVTLFEARRFDDAGAFRTVGVRGCFDSHRRLMHTIAAADDERALVLEDDADFSRHAIARLPALCKALSARDWGLVYGWHPDHETARDTPDDARIVDLPPVVPVLRLHCHIVTRDTAARVAPFLDRMLERPAGSPEGGPMDVDGALGWFRAANPDVVTLCPIAPIAVQRPSRSDIDGGRWYDRLPVLAPALAVLRRVKSAIRP